MAASDTFLGSTYLQPIRIINDAVHLYTLSTKYYLIMVYFNGIFHLTMAHLISTIRWPLVLWEILNFISHWILLFHTAHFHKSTIFFYSWCIRLFDPYSLYAFCSSSNTIPSSNNLNKCYTSILSFKSYIYYVSCSFCRCHWFQQWKNPLFL